MTAVYTDAVTLEDEIRKTRRIPLPLDRARHAIDLLEPIAKDLVREVYAVRNAAVLEASRDGVTYQQIAATLGYSKAQVQNMIAAAKEDEAALEGLLGGNAGS